MTEQEIQNILHDISIASSYCKKDMQEEWATVPYNIALRLSGSNSETDIKNLRTFGYAARIVLDVEGNKRWEEITNFITCRWREKANISLVGIYLLTYMKRGLEIVENSFGEFHKRQEELAKAMQDERDARDAVKSEGKKIRKEKKKAGKKQ